MLKDKLLCSCSQLPPHMKFDRRNPRKRDNAIGEAQQSEGKFVELTDFLSNLRRNLGRNSPIYNLGEERTQNLGFGSWKIKKKEPVPFSPLLLRLRGDDDDDF